MSFSQIRLVKIFREIKIYESIKSTLFTSTAPDYRESLPVLCFLEEEFVR